MFRETLNYDSFKITRVAAVSQALSVLSVADLEPSAVVFQPFMKQPVIFLWTSGPRVYRLESGDCVLYIKIHNCILYTTVGSKPDVTSGNNSVMSYCIILMSVNCHFRL